MIVFDAGALVALDRGDRRVWADLKAAALEGIELAAPAGVVAQVWRGSPRQARLARALRGCVISSFDVIARAAGEVCGQAGTSDVVDASVVLTAVRQGATHLYTSDPDDIGHLLMALGDRRVKIVRCWWMCSLRTRSRLMWMRFPMARSWSSVA